MATEQLLVRLSLDAARYNSSARQAATATNQIGTSATQTQQATGKLDKSMSTFATTAKFAVAGAAAAAVTGFAKDSVGAFLDFDDAMNESLAIMGDVSETMRGQMSDAAREVGKTTRISATEAAESYFFLASAGLDAEQSIAALPQVAAFAQAGMFDMATATDLATDAQSALGLVASDAGENLENLTRVTDVLVGANTLANASVEQFSESLTNKAGAAMRSVGIEIEEGVAVLAAFADQGVKGTEAGTQFAIVLRDLQTRALQNKEAFAEAGISVFDASGEFRNFADIIGELETRLGGMSDEQKKAELTTLGFTDKSIAALTVLLGTSDAIREYESGLRDMGGTTQEVADNQLKSFRGQLDLLKGQVEDAQIALGSMITPALVDTASDLTAVLGDLASVAETLGSIGTGGDGGFISFLMDTLPGAGVIDVIKFVSGELAYMTETMYGVDEAAGDASESTDTLTTSNELLADRLIAASEGMDATTGSTVALNDSTTELTTSVEALKFAEDRQRDATKAAREAILAKRDALREVHDPLFRVVSLNDDLAEAEEAVEEASKKGVASPEYRDAAIDRANVIADLKDTMRELKSQGIDPTGAAARIMFEELGIPDHVINEIFAQFDALEENFESRLFQASFSIPTFNVNQGGGVQRTGEKVIHGQHGGIFEPRPGGTFVNLAEAGSREALIPLNGEGIQILAAAMQEARGGAVGGAVHITVQGFVGSELQLAEELNRLLTRRERTSGVSF